MDAAPILELIDAFRRSKTMFTALSLGVFERMEEEPLQASAFAVEKGLDADATVRLLEACVGLGLLEATASGFRNTAVASTYLTRRSPYSLAGYIKYSDDVLYPMWGHLGDAVREGTNRWRQTFGLSSGALFDRFFHTDEAMRTFLMGMHGFGSLSSPAVVRAFDLSRFNTIADLGGATGHLAMAACECYPKIRGIVFDLPRVAAFAREIVSQSSVASRVSVSSGDFFVDELPGSDLYSLGRILHDWSADRIAQLLKKIALKLPGGGGLLIAEKIIDEDHSGPVHAQMQSLNMLICTDGRERSLSEYAALLKAAGFREVVGKKTGAPVDAILATK